MELNVDSRVRRVDAAGVSVDLALSTAPSSSLKVLSTTLLSFSNLAK